MLCCILLTLVFHRFKKDVANVWKDFEIPVEVYKRFILPGQYLYGKKSDMDGNRISSGFATKRATLGTFIHETNNDATDGSKIGQKAGIQKIKEAVELWADEYK